MPQSLPAWKAVDDRRARLRMDQRPGGDAAAIVWRIAR